MWISARACLLGVTVAAAGLLAACGGGGGGKDDHGAEFGVSVKVNGVADASNPLTTGESTTISVPSGSALVFDSEGETTWAPKATGSNFEVTNFSLTSKSMGVTSNGGGKLVIVFADKAQASKSATLTINVAPKEFAQVARVDGELETWSSVTTNAVGEVTRDPDILKRTSFLDDGYAVELGSVSPDIFYGRSLYDSQDRLLGSSQVDGSLPCLYDQPVVNVAYPLHVGLTWGGHATSHCGDQAHPLINSQTYSGTVETYEQVTVAQGKHDALRIKWVADFSVSDPNGTRSYTVNKTCWWAIDLGRYVKCNAAYTSVDDDPSSNVQELKALKR